MSDNSCPVCGNTDAICKLYGDLYEFVTCPVCGRFKIDTVPFRQNSVDCNYLDKLATYLYYNNGKTNIPINADKEYFYNFIGSEKFFEAEKEKYSYCFNVTKIVVENWYPKTLKEKIDYFLLNLYVRQNYFGEGIKFSKEELNSACFLTTCDKYGTKYSPEIIENQVKQFTDYLVKQQYIDIDKYSSTTITLTATGLQKVEKLQSNNNANKNVFVSMAFNDKTKDTRKAIKEGIISSGYSPEFIDEIIHNKQIVPEMFRLIRESRFLILEISEPNYGAYYEAGYALGLGKEVIICCNEDVFNNNIPKFNKDISEEEFKKFQKYLKPHFDIAQKQILVWKDHEDLSNKLSEWIKAII